MSLTKIKLNIANTIIALESKFPREKFSKLEEEIQHSERFKNFFYNGNKKPDIFTNIEIVNKLPKLQGGNDLFVTYHPDDGSENWRLLRKDNTYIYKTPLKDKKQLMQINETFDRVNAYLLPKKEKGWVWNTSDIIYDFLQVLLINYFAQRNLGIFTHSMGVKDLDGRGLLFAGKSGCGKTTLAKLWHKQSRAMVLNDDRIIVRKVKGKFLIYGLPWHGEFSDYLTSRIESAPLERIFFIHHSSKNRAKQISQKKAFSLLYPALFPTFWDRECLENIVSFCQDLISKVPCYRFGFVNDKKIIKFARKVR